MFLDKESINDFIDNLITMTRNNEVRWDYNINSKQVNCVVDHVKYKKYGELNNAHIRVAFQSNRDELVIEYSGDMFITFQIFSDDYKSLLTLWNLLEDPSPNHNLTFYPYIYKYSSTKYLIWSTT